MIHKYYLMRGDDFKAREWAKANMNGNFKVIPIGGSKILFTLKVFKRLFKGFYPTVIVIRYLNDYTNFVKSLLLLISEVALYVVVWAVKIDIIWICHNVDKETQSYHPKLTNIRRHLITKIASKIFVTDKLLMEHAMNVFSMSENKISFTTFGKYKSNIMSFKNYINYRVEDNIYNYYQGISFDDLLIKSKYINSKTNFTGFCAGKYSDKKIYYDLLPKFFENADKNKISLSFVVISDLDKNINADLFQFLKLRKEVIFINNLMNIDEYKLSKWIDFYWLAYDDISIPYTIYSASSNNKPIICYDKGILPMIVEYYNIGCTIEKDFSNLKEVFSNNIGTKDFDFCTFLKCHTWQKGIDQLVHYK